MLQEYQPLDEAEIIFTIKNYGFPGGFSHKIFSEPEGTYQIKGHMGKGLGIEKHGTHLAFCGGTGLLVFVDLVAFLVRQNLGLLNEEDMSILDQESFKFVLYISFPKKEDVVAIEMIEGLRDIT